MRIRTWVTLCPVLTVAVAAKAPRASTRVKVNHNRIIDFSIYSYSEEMTELNELANPRWEAIWNNGLKPGERFDANAPSPMLLQLLQQPGLIPDGRALVPGCGRGYDVTALASATRLAVGIELADKAVEAAQERLQSLPADQCSSKSNAQFRVANFFDLPGTTAAAGATAAAADAVTTEPFDFVYDYTFLCALHPSVRTQWAQQMAKLLRPGGLLLTLIFPIREDDGNGPPYAVSLQLLRDLLEPAGFSCEQLQLLPPELCHAGRADMSGIGLWRKN